MNDKLHLLKFFETDFPLNKEGLNELILSFQVKEYPKNSIILSEGEHEEKLRFINKGIVREYYKNTHKEINLNFYITPQFITDFSSFIHHSCTKKNLESLSTIQVLELSKVKFTDLLEKFSCGNAFINMTFQNIVKNKELLEYNRMTKEPEELYNELRMYKPEWLQSIPQYHIASYLGITAETLSRIRKRIS